MRQWKRDGYQLRKLNEILRLFPLGLLQIVSEIVENHEYQMARAEIDKKDEEETESSDDDETDDEDDGKRQNP